MMFKRPSCLQGRRDDGSSKNNKSSGGDDWSAFPVRQLFVLGMLNDAQYFPIGKLTIASTLSHL